MLQSPVPHESTSGCTRRVSAGSRLARDLDLVCCVGWSSNCRASSSSWQSSGLLIRGLWVRTPRGPPPAETLPAGAVQRSYKGVCRQSDPRGRVGSRGSCIEVTAGPAGQTGSSALRRDPGSRGRRRRRSRARPDRRAGLDDRCGPSPAAPGAARKAARRGTGDEGRASAADRGGEPRTAAGRKCRHEAGQVLTRIPRQRAPWPPRRLCPARPGGVIVPWSHQRAARPSRSTRRWPGCP